MTDRDKTAIIGAVEKLQTARQKKRQAWDNRTVCQKQLSYADEAYKQSEMDVLNQEAAFNALLDPTPIIQQGK